LSRKSKKSPKNDNGDESGQPIVIGFAPLFSPEFKLDLRWWYRYEPKKADRIMDLLADILDGDPFVGLGKPEPLKYVAPNTWSRRIDLEHRLVYQVDGNRITFLQARYHYEE
jgi:toxin YoeB